MRSPIHDGSKLLLLLAIFLLPAASSAQYHPLEEQIKHELEKQVPVVRGFPREDQIEYDRHGIPKSNIHQFPWTFCIFDIRSVKIGNDGVKLTGYRRVAYHYDFQKFLLEYVAPMVLRVEMPLAEIDKASIDAALRNIFIFDREDLVKAVPDYWVPYLSDEVTWDKTGHAHVQGWPRSDRLIYTRSDGIEMPKPLYTPDYDYREVSWMLTHWYPECESSTCFTRVRFTALIDAAGNVQSFVVTDPVGVGFEEEAVKVLKQWKYKPATLNGKPVASLVPVQIDFRYSSSGRRY